MQFESTTLDGVIKIFPDIHYDHRGEYVETWNEENYKALNNINFKQDDISVSVKHTLRGLHGDDSTWKLVQCVYGSMLLAVVDMRDGYGHLEYELFNINDKNRMQVLIPPNFANGHLVMSHLGVFSYKQSTLYTGAYKQFTIRWDDPLIDIPWPVKNPILSVRDSQAKFIELFT